MENLTIMNLFKKGSLISLAKILVPGILYLAFLCAFSLQSDFHFDTLSRDPIQLLNGKAYTGILSRTGIVLWCATAAILFFSPKISSLQGKTKNITSFLFFAGLLTSFMMIDDFFLMHDVVFPEYLHIDEKVFYCFYGSSVVAIFYFFRKIVLNSDYILLLLSFSFLAVSALTDVVMVLGLTIPYPFVIEDGFKFLGIISWFAYFTRTSYMHIKPVGLLK